MSVIEFEDKKPNINSSVFLAPNSWIIGDVTLDDEVNVWTNAVIRGDDNSVHIGAKTTVLEGCLIEAPTGSPVKIGSNTIISHGAVVHGANIGNKCIIGIGAIILDGSRVGDGAIIGSGALVSPSSIIPENHLALGIPAKILREIRDSEREYMAKEHQRTLSKAKVYKKIYKK